MQSSGLNLKVLSSRGAEWSRPLSIELVLDKIGFLPPPSSLTASVPPQDRVDFLQLMIDSQSSQDSSKSAREKDSYKCMS